MQTYFIQYILYENVPRFIKMKMSISKQKRRAYTSHHVRARCCRREVSIGYGQEFNLYRI